MRLFFIPSDSFRNDRDLRFPDVTVDMKNQTTGAVVKRMIAGFGSKRKSVRNQCYDCSSEEELEQGRR